MNPYFEGFIPEWCFSPSSLKRWDSFEKKKWIGSVLFLHFLHEGVSLRPCYLPQKAKSRMILNHWCRILSLVDNLSPLKEYSWAFLAPRPLNGSQGSSQYFHKGFSRRPIIIWRIWVKAASGKIRIYLV